MPLNLAKTCVEAGQGVKVSGRIKCVRVTAWTDVFFAMTNCKWLDGGESLIPLLTCVS